MCHNCGAADEQLQSYTSFGCTHLHQEHQGRQPRPVAVRDEQHPDALRAARQASLSLDLLHCLATLQQLCVDNCRAGTSEFCSLALTAGLLTACAGQHLRHEGQELDHLRGCRQLLHSGVLVPQAGGEVVAVPGSMKSV